MSTEETKRGAGEPTFRVREANEYDTTVIHALGSGATELNVGGAGGGFPSLNELDEQVDGPDANWLVVEDEMGRVWGFICSRSDDPDVRRQRSACIVYLFVERRHRGKGLAKMLWDAMQIMLGAAGVEHVYTWASSKDSAEFFERQGLKMGKACFWMDAVLKLRRSRPSQGKDGGR